MPPEEIDGLQLRSPNHSHREHVMNASTNSISRTRESVFTKVCFHYFRFFIFFFKEENEGRGRNSFLSFFVICRILFHWPNFSSSFLEVRTFARAYAFFFCFFAVLISVKLRLIDALSNGRRFSSTDLDALGLQASCCHGSSCAPMRKLT